MRCFVAFAALTVIALQATIAWCEEVAKLAVVEVNVTNFFPLFDSPPLLLQFSAPWCASCARFQSTFESVAKQLHASDKDFKWIPVLFLYRDNKLFQLKEAHTMSPSHIVQYCRLGYRSDDPVPWADSPLGLVGRAKMALLRVGAWALLSTNSLCDELGLQIWQAVLLIMAAGVGMVTVVAVLVAVVAMRHLKLD